MNSTLSGSATDLLIKATDSPWPQTWLPGRGWWWRWRPWCWSAWSWLAGTPCPPPAPGLSPPVSRGATTALPKTPVATPSVSRGPARCVEGNTPGEDRAGNVRSRDNYCLLLSCQCRYGTCAEGLMCSNCNRCQGCSFRTFICWDDRNCIWWSTEQLKTLICIIISLNVSQ